MEAKDDKIVMDQCKEFIKDVKSRPALWNKDDSAYGHRGTVDVLWKELSIKYGVSIDQMKNKWRGLRDSFSRNLRREMVFRKAYPNDKLVHRWRYFVPLLFLKSQLIAGKKSNPPQNLIKPKTEADSNEEDVDFMEEYNALDPSYVEEENCSIPPEDNSTFIDPQGFDFQMDSSSGEQKPSTLLSALLRSFQKDIMDLEREKANTLNLNATDDDILFLHSLLPYFRSLDMKSKLILRTKIQQLVSENLTDEKNVVPTLNKPC